MRGRAKRRKMAARFRAPWWVRIIRAGRVLARRLARSLQTAFAGVRRAITREPRREDYALTAGPGGDQS